MASKQGDLRVFVDDEKYVEIPNYIGRCFEIFDSNKKLINIVRIDGLLKHSIAQMSTYVGLSIVTCGKGKKKIIVIDNCRPVNSIDLINAKEISNQNFNRKLSAFKARII